jgi:poly(A) polymerase
LRRSGEVAERAAWLVANHLRHVQAREMRVSTLRRFLGEPRIGELLDLVRIDALSGSGDLSSWEFCQERLRNLAAGDHRPAPWLRGRDLIALGYTPGPGFRRILDEAYDAQLEGEIDSADAARSWVRTKYAGDDGG